MKVEHLNIIGQRSFQEVTKPKDIFQLKDGVTAVYHGYYGQWTGRHQDIRKESITLFSDNGKKTIGHLDSLRFEVNDIDFDPINNQVVIAIGSYDGGCYFEGELLIWNLNTGEIQKIVEDNREFIYCKFEQDKIKFKVNPTDDIMTQDFTIKTYELDRGKLISKLEDLIPVDSIEFSWDRSPKKRNPNLENLIKEKEPKFKLNSIIWDLVFVGDKIVSGNSFGRITSYDYLNNVEESIQIREAGECVQVFNTKNNKVVVNLAYRDRENDDTYLFEVDVLDKSCRQKLKGKFSISKSAENYFLARQVNHQYGKNQDIILDENFETIHSIDLGHYDLFNHYVRIDDDKYLYAYIGKPKNQHRKKELWKINPSTAEQTKQISIEAKCQINEPNFLKIKDLIISQGKEYEPRYGTYQMNAYDLLGNKIWEIELEANAIDLKAIRDIDNCFVAVYNNGKVKIHSSDDGKVIKELNQYLSVVNSRAMCAATKDNIVAIGYDNGMIEILKIAVE